MGTFIDTSDFDNGMRRLMREAMPAAVERGLAAAAMTLLDDAINATPSVPLDEGTLRGSGSAFSMNRLVGTTEDQGDGGTPARVHKETIGAGEYVGVAGFNTPYAARLHEAPEDWKWSEPGSGPKFVEAKLAGRRDEYIGVVADTIRKDLG